jgi:hypothetical protein
MFTNSESIPRLAKTLRVATRMYRWSLIVAVCAAVPFLVVVNTTQNSRAPLWVRAPLAAAFVIGVAAAVAFAVAFFVALGAQVRLRTVLFRCHGLVCPGCGYPMPVVDADRCPECGREWRGVSKEWGDLYCVALPDDT